MTALTLIWIASIAGVVLFAAFGFFAARAMQRKEAGATDDPSAAEAARARAELAHAVARAQQAEQLIASARQEAERATRDLAETRASERMRAQELAAAQAASSRAAQELAETKGAADRAARELAQKAESFARAREALEDRTSAVARLEKELAAARSRAAVGTTAAAEGARSSKRIAELETAVATAKSELEAVSAKERKMAELLDQTRSRSRQLESELEAMRSGGDALRRETALRAEESSAAKQALESARADLAKLRQEGAAASELRGRIAELERENERLRAAEFAARAKAPSISDASAVAVPPASEHSGALDGVSLQRFVDDVVQSSTVSAAAVTDELGFLVVGNGDHTEALAAFGAYLTEAGARACGLLPMHAVQEVSVQDDSGIKLTARTIAPAPNELVLVTLGVETGRGRDKKLVDQRERSS